MDGYIRHYNNEPFVFTCYVYGITLKPYSIKNHKSSKRQQKNVDEFLYNTKSKMSKTSNYVFKSIFLLDTNQTKPSYIS